jgi:nucleoside-diphosphate-sugar epimerase
VERSTESKESFQPQKIIPNNLSPYGVFKLACERYLNYYHA